MTTYTLTQGTIVFRDPSTDDVTGVDQSDVTFEMVVEDTEVSFSYVVEPLPPGDGPGDETVDITLDVFGLRLNGTPVGESQTVDPIASIFDVGWTDGGSLKQSIVLVLFVENDPISGGGTQDADYIFVLDGDAFPVLNSATDWNSFESTQLQSVDIPTGAYGPGTDIALTSIGATVSQKDFVVGTAGNDVFKTGAGNDDVAGLGGRDTLNGGAGKDTLKGGAQKDDLRGGAGNDILFGNSGNDKLSGGKGRDTLNGGDGADILNGGTGRDALNGQAGDDTLRGGEDNDVLNGQAGEDRLEGGSGRDVLDGGTQNDVLLGGAGDDILSGGGGRDTLNGNNGNDTLSGGTARDTFVFSAGQDSITDFTPRDVIDLTSVSSIKSFNDLKNNHTTDVGGSLVIDDGKGNTLTLFGVVEADLKANDFIF